MKIDNAAVLLTLLTTEEINDNSIPYRTLYNYLIDWAAMGDLYKIKFDQDGGNPLLYSWSVELNNGRVLNSVFLFDSDHDLDPEVTIDLPLGWPLSVIACGANTRAQLIAIRCDFGISSFKVEFL